MKMKKDAVYTNSVIKELKEKISKNHKELNSIENRIIKTLNKLKSTLSNVKLEQKKISVNYLGYQNERILTICSKLTADKIKFQEVSNKLAENEIHLSNIEKIINELTKNNLEE